MMLDILQTEKQPNHRFFEEHKPLVWPWSFPCSDELINAACLSFGLNVEENVSVNCIWQCSSQILRCNSINTKDNSKKTEQISLCIVLKNMDECAGSKVCTEARTATIFQVLLLMTVMGSQGKKQYS